MGESLFHWCGVSTQDDEKVLEMENGRAVQCCEPTTTDLDT